MTINIGGGELKELKPRILVMGIGGAGGNGENGGTGGDWGENGADTIDSGDGGTAGKAIDRSTNVSVGGIINSNTIKGIF